MVQHRLDIDLLAEDILTVKSLPEEDSQNLAASFHQD
jgi:hypothetical protein